MNAFLFNAWLSQVQAGAHHEWSVAATVVGAPEAEARAWYEQQLLAAYAADSPVPARIEQLLGAPFLPDWIGAAGVLPAEWARLAAGQVPAEAVDAAEDWDAGFWVDCEEVLRGTGAITDLRALRAHLPPDLSDGLNWDTNRPRHLFLSVLKPKLSPPTEPRYDDDGTRLESAQEPVFPGMVERVAATVVVAANAVHAGWLWRRHIAGSALANLPIRIECPVPVHQFG